MSGDGAIPEYVRALLDPAPYPHAPAGIELRQTHISWVFLAGDVVYKTKKPVDFGFISQLDAETRERFCHAELRLNRRLAPGVYLGVVPIVRMPDGRYVVEGDPAAGEVVEHAVKMRRLPDARTLDRLLAAGAAPADLAERLARRLIAFHESAAVVENDPDFAGASAERAWWAREYGEAAGFIGDTWRPEDAAATRAFIEDTLERDAALFDARLSAGRVIEGHGDLRAAHVYMLDDDDPRGEAITIVDCIEFSEQFHFRYLDAGYDVAFLAMDLEALGHADLGDELAGRYLAAAGDETLGLLQPLHRAYRAFVRGKVESIGARAPETPEEQSRALAASAARFFRLAASYAVRRAAPQLIALSGLPASGKSTVAATLACRIGAAYLSSDVVRKQLAGIDPRERVRDEWRSGRARRHRHHPLRTGDSGCLASHDCSGLSRPPGGERAGGHRQKRGHRPRHRPPIGYPRADGAQQQDNQGQGRREPEGGRPQVRAQAQEAFSRTVVFDERAHVQPAPASDEHAHVAIIRPAFVHDYGPYRG